MTTVFDLLSEDPTNPVVNSNNVTNSNKPWANSYHPLWNLIVHTYLGADNLVHANWESVFCPLGDDDSYRLASPAERPSPRLWSFNTEADCELWFHTEVSNVVLSA